MSLSKKRVLVLLHQELIPPEKATKKELETADWKTEYYVVKALQDLGHEVNILGVLADLSPISERIASFKPQITFNLVEEFAGKALLDQNVVSFLELKSLAYTGCSPRGLILARDKAISKKILAYHRIPVPRFQSFPLSRKIKLKSKFKFPLIVKSLFEEASLGISKASVVHNQEKLKERVQFIHESLETPAIVEEFIEGREIYISVLGNRRLEVFPPWELLFDKDAQAGEQIATSQVKHSFKYRERHKITTDFAKDISEASIQKMNRIARRVYRLLYLSGYARIDFRLRNDGIPYVLEANPNPEISDYDDFSMAAYQSGYEYEQLIDKILRLALKRPKDLL